jgi:hypothetical protein
MTTRKVFDARALLLDSRADLPREGEPYDGEVRVGVGSRVWREDEIWVLRG